MAAIAVGYTLEALRYPLGTLSNPGPGLFPLTVGLAILMGSVGVAFDAASSSPFEVITWPDRAGVLRVAALSMAMAAFITVLPTLGFLLPGALVVAVSMVATGERRWPLVTVIALTLTVLAYLAFALLLGVPIHVSSTVKHGKLSASVRGIRQQRRGDAIFSSSRTAGAVPVRRAAAGATGQRWPG